MSSFPADNSVILKDVYKNLVFILNCISYKEHEWLISKDLKIVGLLNGLQSGYTKFMFFLCKWDTRARSQNYACTEMPIRVAMTPECHYECKSLATN